jgi:hypothetical protein
MPIRESESTLAIRSESHSREWNIRYVSSPHESRLSHINPEIEDLPFNFRD